MMTTPKTTFAKLVAKDPTKTITLRNKFVSDVNRRFNALKKVVSVSVRDNDCFGLKNKEKHILGLVSNESMSPLGYRAFEYRNDPQKIQLFKEWLDDQIELGILEVIEVPGAWGVNATERPWTDFYIQSSYQKGILKGRRDLIAEGAEGLPPVDDGLENGLQSLFNQPFHADRVGVLYYRTFEDLKNVTSAMSAQMSNVLAQGLAEGRGIKDIARLLNDRVDKIGKVRARLIARTEIIRAANVAGLGEYEMASSIIGEEVLAQWQTAEDEKVRDRHALWNHLVMTRQEAVARLGAPNCRCTLLPFITSLHRDEVYKKTKAARKIIGRRNN